MFAFLRDPIWQSIGAILAFIALGVPLFLYFKQKNRKSLIYSIPTKTELLAIHYRDVREKFKMTYEGIPVENVYLIIIRFANNGNLPILVSDFDSELKFSFGENAHVISAEVINPSRKNVRPKLNIAKTAVGVQRLLLNSKDAV
jgi:hypothetical protein